MKFGFENRKQHTGADLYVGAMQIVSLLPALYILVGPSYPALFVRKSVMSVLFDLGFSALPRLETLALSLLYRLTASEVTTFFVLVGGALVFGLAAKKLLSRAPRATRLVCAALIAVDLVLRLLPLRCNTAFGTPCAIAGFAVRLACLILILLDLRAAKQAK